MTHSDTGHSSGRTLYGNFLDKAPPPSKLYKNPGILAQQIFCTVLKGDPPSKLYKTPIKGGP
jgi:hypothetical protein